MFIAEKEVTANVSKLIFGVAIAAASIATPALAAHESKPISAHRNGYVTRSNQGSGVYNFVPGSSSVYYPKRGRMFMFRAWPRVSEIRRSRSCRIFCASDKRLAPPRPC